MALLGFGTQGRLGPLCDIISRIVFRCRFVYFLGGGFMGKLWTGDGYVLQRTSWMVLSLLLIRCCCSGPCILVIRIVASLTIDEVTHRIIFVLLLGFGTQGRLRPLGDIIERSSLCCRCGR